MKKKNIIFIALIFSTFILSCAPEKHDTKYNIQGYVAQYDTVWPQVAEYIIKSWQNNTSSGSNIPYPFTSSVHGSNLMNYFDTWFINKGLLISGEYEQARNNIDNHLHQIDAIGYVPSVNTGWGAACSNPPYLSSMVREYYEISGGASVQWLDSAYLLLKREYQFWTNATDTLHGKRSSGIPGLSRYFHEENPMAMMLFYTKELVSRMEFPPQVPQEMMMKAASQYLAEVESGMSFTPRFERRSPDFAALDLNVCLYMYEMNFAWMAEELNLTDEPDWEKRAENRRLLIQKYCWNEELGLFMDYDFENERFSNVPAVTAFTPLMAGIATAEQAESTRQNLDMFEHDMGVAVCPEEERERNYLWDFPSAMPPMHYYVIEGLRNYDMHADARRIAVKYLDLVSQNFVYPLPETCGSMPVKRNPGHLYNKYTTLGTLNDSEYCATISLGWTAGVFLYAQNYISSEASEVAE